MEHEKYSYVEALKWIAARYNIEIEETATSPEVKQQQQVAEDSEDDERNRDHHRGVLGLELVQAADPRPDIHAAGVRGIVLEIDPRIGDGRNARGHRDIAVED